MRVTYIQHLALGVVVANTHIEFKAPILLANKIQVQVRISRLGEKSLDMDYQIAGKMEEKIYATGSTVLVAYNYR